VTEDAAAAIAREAERLRDARLLDLFAVDPRRAEQLTLEAPHLRADFSKQRIDAAALAALGALADGAEFDLWRARLFAGALVNTTEQRAAKHWALRAADAPAEVRETRTRIAAFADAVRAQFNAVVHIGIGGSDLGPRLVLDALKPLRVDGLAVRFAANVDSADIADALEGLEPARTLAIVASKTFTTQETLMNARVARDWGAGRIVAVTAAPERATAWGVRGEDVFPFWDWVGGRYSLWSSVGLVCVLALRENAFFGLLEGAAAMDVHFRDTPFASNLAALAGAIQHWNRAALGHSSYALLPYVERLRLLPAWMQQLEMESNGKGVDRDGRTLAQPAAGVTWGGAGTTAQHSFFQLMHQGVQEIPAEFIITERDDAVPAHRLAVRANALAQARALMTGKSAAQAKADMLAAGMNDAEASRLAPHRACRGDRASTILALDALTPQALGALLAFYEHRTFTQAVLTGINPFDQFGVELGKEMAGLLAPALAGERGPDGLDASTAAWIERLRAR
jgi:glucose-6-phosphate isomerase